MEEIYSDTLETIITDKGTYKVHTDCYNKICKEAQKDLLEDMRKHHLRALEKTEDEKAMLCHTFSIKYIDVRLEKNG